VQPAALLAHLYPSGCVYDVNKLLVQYTGRRAAEYGVYGLPLDFVDAALLAARTPGSYPSVTGFPLETFEHFIEMQCGSVLDSARSVRDDHE